MATQQSTQASLGTVTAFPALAPGYHLAPASIGRPGQPTQLVFVACADWCTEDHVADRQIAVEDVVHSSETAHLGIRSFLGGRVAIELYATIKQDPAAHDERLRQAHIVLDDGSDDAHLTVDQAEDAVEQLLKLTSDLQQLIRTARLHNVAAEAEAVVA
ncbi:DUF6907 domain-containing protein [Streptomyces sp. NPDC053086]|uniref:DUF6907 domain-containing protein n=1 Tax=unclassified Streptomyces TaxID=2593676 RepID=UPI0037D08042